MTFKTDWIVGDIGHATAHNEIGAWLNSTPPGNVQNYGALADGINDDTAAFVAAAATGSIYVPRTANYYSITSPIVLLSNTTVWGQGTIHQTGITDDTGDTAVFIVPDGVENVSFFGLTFTGDHVSNASSYKPGTIHCPGSTSKNITIDRCHFVNTVGQPIYAGDIENVKVTDCTFVHCGGAVNCNAKYTKISGCHFENSMGCECSGESLIITGNTFINGLATSDISIGGYTLAGHYEPCAVVSSNIIRNTSAVCAIITAESSRNVVIANNSIDGMVADSSAAIEVPSLSEGMVSANILITSNVINNMAHAGIVVLGAGVTDVSIIGNQIGDADRSVSFGIICYLSGAIIKSNIIKSSSHAVTIANTATDVVIDGNDYGGRELHIVSGGSVVSGINVIDTVTGSLMRLTSDNGAVVSNVI